jgi:integrase
VAQRVAVAIDRRTVVNPVQARTLLAAVRETRRSGPRLVAFFALMYFTALRPEEAANIRKHNLSLLAQGWGELHLEQAAPHAGSDWTGLLHATRGSPRAHRDLWDGAGRAAVPRRARGRAAQANLYARLACGAQARIQ